MAVEQMPSVCDVEIKRLIPESYGAVATKIQRLNSYDDLTVRVWLSSASSCALGRIDDNGYVFKVTNSVDSKNTDLINAQNEFLQLACSAGIPSPLPQLTVERRYYNRVTVTYDDKNANRSEGDHIVRMFSFIPGKLICSVEYSRSLLMEVGSTLAKLHLAIWNSCLQNFSKKTPGLRGGHEFWWSLEALPLSKSRLSCYDDNPERKTMMLKYFDLFDQEVLECMDRFPKCLLHGDFNEQNLLTDGKHVSGVIDFNDFQHSCRIFDVALAMVYLMMDAKTDKVDAGGFVLLGYLSCLKTSATRQQWRLTAEEFQVLRICACGRLVQSLVNGKYTWDLNPVKENEYVMVTQEKGWTLLKELDTLGEEVPKKWLNIINEADVHL